MRKVIRMQNAECSHPSLFHRRNVGCRRIDYQQLTLLELLRVLVATKAATKRIETATLATKEELVDILISSVVIIIYTFQERSIL
jgi:hypothetical protein